MNNNRKYFIFFICLIAFAVAAYFFLTRSVNEKESQNSEGFRHFKVETFEEKTGWGYEILEEGKIVIKQPYIPGIPGTIGFKSKELAVQTGNLVIQKLENGVFPPTVSPHELDSIGVKY